MDVLLFGSDQDPALVSFLQDVASSRHYSGTFSPAGESQANCRAERDVRLFEELLRVHKLARTSEELRSVHKLTLESRIGEKISVEHNLFPRLIDFVTTVVNLRLAGKDSRTAYERAKHKLQKVKWCHVMIRVSGNKWFDGRTAVPRCSVCNSGELCRALDCTNLCWNCSEDEGRQGIASEDHD